MTHKSALAPPGRQTVRLSYLLIVPAVAGLILFQFYPMALALLGSFQDFNPFNHEVNGFAGFGNYNALFADPQFRRAFLNTVAYVALVILLEVPIGLALAMLINRHLPGSGVLRLAVIACLAASETVAILVWNQMYSTQGGVFNAILKTVGLPEQAFVESPVQALPSLVIISVWKDIGLPTLIFLAGLQTVPEEVYEAASLDGAGSFREFWYVTVPLMRGTTVVAIFMATVTGSRIFTSIYLITQGGPKDSTRNLIYYAYQQGFQYSAYGAAYAGTVCMLVVLGLITAIQLTLFRERT